jgi:hypothetical protein
VRRADGQHRRQRHQARAAGLGCGKRCAVLGHQTGNIVNALTAHDCLDLTDGKAVAGTQLQIWGCGFFGGVDNTNQDWIETDAF